MNAKVFCFASSKGGSGKTILTGNIASFLNEIGKKCLIIDCDAATHGMTLLYITEVSKNIGNKSSGLFELSDDETLTDTLKSSILKVENGIDFLPATYNFKAGFDPEEKFQVNPLQKIIKLLRNNYDMIFLDAQAGSDKYSRLAMNKDVSDEVIIVSEYDPLSAAGIERLKQVIGQDLDYTRTWILLNKMLPEFVEKFSEFLTVAKYLPPIPWNADVVRAYARSRLSIDIEWGNIFTLSIIRTVETLLGDSISGIIQKWKEDKTALLRQPIINQYNTAEMELHALLEERQAALQARPTPWPRSFTVTLLAATALFSLFTFIYISNTYIIPGDYTQIFSALVSAIHTAFDRLSLIEVSDFIMSAITIMISMIVIITIYNQWNTIRNRNIHKPPDEVMDELRFERKVEALKNQLIQLESLRVADLKTIIENNNRK